VVSAVFENSPAYLAGLKRGDIVSQVNGEKIESADQLLILVSSHRPDDVLELVGSRRTEPLSVQIRLAERPNLKTLRQNN